MVLWSFSSWAASGLGRFALFEGVPIESGALRLLDPVVNCDDDDMVDSKPATCLLPLLPLAGHDCLPPGIG